MANTTTKMTTQINFKDYISKLVEMLNLQGARISQKSPLSDNEKDEIMSICIDLYDATKNYQQIYEDCCILIYTILSKHNYQPRIPNKSSVSNTMQHLPYQLKILIYTMAYKAFELYDKASNNTKKANTRPTQKGILDFIGTPRTLPKQSSLPPHQRGILCYKLSPKTFTNFGISPKLYYDINNYKQINLPSNYAGAKTNYLGYALNHLVAYAGTVDNYIDLFGGSASAFMAVMKTNNVEYYINEIDFFIVNYYNVIADETLYKAYESELYKVKNNLIIHLKNDTASQAGKDFFNYCKNIENQWSQKYPKTNIDTLANGNIIQSPNWQIYKSETDDNKVDAAIAYTYMHSFTIIGGACSKSKVNDKTIENFCDININEYSKFHAHMSRLKEIYSSDMLTQNEFLINYFTDKPPKKYDSIQQLAQNIRNGNTPSSIGEEEKELLRLLGKDSTGKPRRFRTLFYSDSPYLNTKGYKGGGINVQQMKDLIKKLITASQNESHFIFSCRASKSIEDNTYHIIQDYYIDLNKLSRSHGNVIFDTEHIYEEISFPVSDNNGGFKRQDLKPQKHLRRIAELLQQNYEIYKYIFKEFEKHSNKLYVLACLETNNFNKKTISTEGELLKKKLQSMYAVEVFITDYDFVCPLDYTSNDGKNYLFEKYNISSFCEILDEQMFKSNKSYKVVQKSDATRSGYGFQKIAK